MADIKPASPADFGQIAALTRALTTAAFADDAVAVTEGVSAMAGWIPPGRPAVDIGPDQGIEHPAWRIERIEAIGEAITAQTPSEPHWYLHLLATHPACQPQGLGAEILQQVFDLANAAGLPCHLETESESETNVAYDAHHGVEIRSEWELPPGGPHMSGMFRAARSVADG